MNKKIMGLIIANIGLFIMIIPLSLIVMNDIKQTTSLSKWLDYQQQHSQKLMKERFLVENLSIQKEIVDVFNPESKTSNQQSKIDMDNTIGNLTIPKFNQSFPLYLNASNEKLSKGVATLEGTPAPAGKIGERPVIAGHRTNYNEISFFFLPELKPGDEIYLSAFDQNFVYRVRDTQTILSNTPYAHKASRVLRNDLANAFIVCCSICIQAIFFVFGYGHPARILAVGPSKNDTTTSYSTLIKAR